MSALTEGMGLAQSGSNYLPAMQGLAQQTDPFAAYRPEAAFQLNQLMNDPSRIMMDPGYMWSLSQGEQGLLRNQAAIGGAGSGAEKIALQGYDQGFASNYYNQRLGQLETLANVPGGASQAANILSTGYGGQVQLQQQQSANMMGMIGMMAALAMA